MSVAAVEAIHTKPQLAPSPSGAEVSKNAEMLSDYAQLMAANTVLVAKHLGWDERSQPSPALFLMHLPKDEILPATVSAREMFDSATYRGIIDSYSTKKLSSSHKEADQLNRLSEIGLIRVLADRYLELSKSDLILLGNGSAERPHTHNLDPNLRREAMKHHREMRKAAKKMVIASSRAFLQTAQDKQLDKVAFHDLIHATYLGFREPAARTEAGLTIELSVFNALKSHEEESPIEFTTRFGTVEEDLGDGDIIVESRGKTIFVQTKASPPERMRDEVKGQRGYEIERATNAGERKELGCDAKVTLWPKERSDSVTRLFMPKPNFRLSIERSLEAALA